MMETKSQYALELDPMKSNVFVTQLGERADDTVEEDVNKYPIVKEAAGKLIETGINTIQKTLLLKREVEIEKADEELRAKKEEFRHRMAKCEERRLSIQKKQQSMKDRVLKFDKFIKENEAKRKRAIQKYQTELNLREQKEDELEALMQHIEDLKNRHKKLLEKLKRFKKFEDYLMRVIDALPDNYLEVNDSMLVSLMDRHRTLNTTNQGLVEHVTLLYDHLEKEKERLEELKHKHHQKKMIINSKLSKLQGIQEDRVDANTQLEEVWINDKRTYRMHRQELGQALLAIDNLAERVHGKHDPPLEELSPQGKLAMIMYHLEDKIEVEKMAQLDMATLQERIEKIGKVKKK